MCSAKRCGMVAEAGHALYFTTIGGFAYSGTFHGRETAVFNTLYLRIACDQLHIIHLESGNELQVRAEPPFSNLRLLVADFGVADRLIKEAVTAVIRKRFMRLSLPLRLVMHPLERLEGGLSQVEERILLELGKGSGASKVVVHVGAPLDATGVRACFKKSCA